MNLSFVPFNQGAWPTVAATGSYVYVAWYDNRNGSGNTDILLVYSSNYGVSWSSAVRVDLGDVAGSTNSFYPKLACSGSNVYCTWRDDRTGPRSRSSTTRPTTV